MSLSFNIDEDEMRGPGDFVSVRIEHTMRVVFNAEIKKDRLNNPFDMELLRRQFKIVLADFFHDVDPVVILRETGPVKGGGHEPIR